MSVIQKYIDEYSQMGLIRLDYKNTTVSPDGGFMVFQENQLDSFAGYVNALVNSARQIDQMMTDGSSPRSLAEAISHQLELSILSLHVLGVDPEAILVKRTELLESLRG